MSKEYFITLILLTAMTLSGCNDKDVKGWSNTLWKLIK